MKSFTEIYNDEILTETPTLQYTDTGLPFPIWLDVPNRKIEHNTPRIKIKVDNSLYPLSLSKNPRWLSDNIPRIKRKHMKLIRKFMDTNYDNLKLYWDDDLSIDKLKSKLLKV